MLRLQNGKFRILRQQQQPVQTPAQDVSVSIEIPMLEEPVKSVPDPSTYMVLFTRKVDGHTVKTVSDKKTGNVFVITED
jgi:hypothetical protein